MAQFILEVIGENDQDVHEVFLKTHYKYSEYDACILANFETLLQHIGQQMIIEKNEAVQLIAFLKSFYNI